MSENFFTCDTRQPDEEVYTLTSREPMLWDKKEVVSQDANGYPEDTIFYQGSTIVFTTHQEWTSEGQEILYEVYQP